MFTFQYSDAGQSKTEYALAQRCCTIRAISISTGLSFEACFEIAKQAGRKYNGKIKTRNVLLEAEKYGVKSETVTVTVNRTLTLNQLSKRSFMWSGTFLVRTKGHVFAVIDGVIKDTFLEGSKRRVLEVWRILK